MNKNRIKAFIFRLSSGLIGAGTPIAVIVASPDMYFTKPVGSVSALAIIAIIIGAVSFKDTILKFFKTPTALKVWLFIFVGALLIQSFAHQFVILSAFALAAQGVCIPLNMLDKKYHKRYMQEKAASGDMSAALSTLTSALGGAKK